MSDRSVVTNDDRPPHRTLRPRFGGRRISQLVAPACLALIVGGMAAAMFASHRSGHWWGDDWALYIRQAQGLIDGDPGRVIAENRFTVESSQGAAFSPPLYPWGFPLMLAPFVAVLGPDVDRLAVVQVLCAAVFACCWYDLARRRLGTVPALVGVVAVTMTPLLVGWTELIQSEWPFLAVAGVALVALDRLSAADALTDIHVSLLPLAALGISAAAAFSVRREGLAMIAAIAVAQLAALFAIRSTRWWLEPDRRNAVAARLLVPHTSALIVVAVVQLVLPSTLVPQYSGTSVRNVWRFRADHIDHIAEVAGLKRTWQHDPTVLGSTALGWIAVVAYFTAAVGGVVLAFVLYRRRDLHLVAYAAGALAIGGSFRSPINRYVVTIAPILLLLGLTAIAAVSGLSRWRHSAGIAVTLVAALIAVGNVVQARTRIDNAEAFSGAIEWGPTHPDAVAMFDAVVTLSDPDDVIAAPKARAMTLETGRLAVQVDDFRPIPANVDLALVVVEGDSDLAAAMATDQTFREVWQNSRFVIYQPSSAASASTNGAGSSSTPSP